MSYRWMALPLLLTSGLLLAGCGTNGKKGPADIPVAQLPPDASRVVIEVTGMT